MAEIRVVTCDKCGNPLGDLDGVVMEIIRRNPSGGQSPRLPQRVDMCDACFSDLRNGLTAWLDDIARAREVAQKIATEAEEKPKKGKK